MYLHSKPERLMSKLTLSGMLIRGLYEPWSRSNRSDVHDLISAFVAVQASLIRLYPLIKLS
jgi:hypothetical protein